jgi:hypothetical protein
MFLNYSPLIVHFLTPDTPFIDAVSDYPRPNDTCITQVYRTVSFPLAVVGASELMQAILGPCCNPAAGPRNASGVVSLVPSGESGEVHGGRGMGVGGFDRSDPVAGDRP